MVDWNDKKQYFDDQMITPLLKVMALQNTANKLKISVSTTKMTKIKIYADRLLTEWTEMLIVVDWINQ